MADNVLVDNNDLTDYRPATDEVTFSGDAAHVQIVRPALVTGAEGAKTIVDLAAGNGASNTGTLRVTVASDSTGTTVVTDGGGSITIDAASLPLPTGAATAANQLPNSHDVTIDNAAGAAAVNIQDGGNSITVDGSVSVTGTVTANAGSGPFPVSDNGGSLTIDATSLPLPTGAATAANQLPNSHDVTIDNAAGAAAVNIQDGGNSITVDGSVTVSGTVTANLAAGTNNIGDVDVLTLPALPAGTNNIGDVDVLSIAAGDNNIGNVDIVTMPNVTLAAGTNTNEVVGDVAHSIAAAGNPLGVGGISQDTDDTAPPNRVDAEGDATRLATDRDGSLFVRTHGPQVWTYHFNGSTAQTDATVHAAPGAGLSLYVGTITFSSGAATAINLFFEEGASTVIGPFYLEATAGRGMAVTFNPPRKITANTALTMTTSAAIAHSVDVTGFTAQG